MNPVDSELVAMKKSLVNAESLKYVNVALNNILTAVD